MSKTKRLMLVILILFLSACVDRKEEERYRKMAEENQKRANMEKSNCTFGQENGLRESVVNNIVFKEEIRQDIRNCIRDLPHQEDQDNLKEAIETCEEMAYRLNGGIRSTDSFLVNDIDLIREVRSNIEQCGDVKKKLDLK